MRINELRQKSAWNPNEYNDFLRNKGHAYPKQESSYTYITVHGQTDYFPEEQPFTLVIYSPEKQEINFSKLDQAERYISKVNPEQWQIINFSKNEILSDPYK